jgi:hypothetical protein
MKTKNTSFVAISAIWYERYLECSRTLRTSVFVDSVWRFYHSLLNIGSGDLAIKDKVSEYYKDIWQPKLLDKYNEEVRVNNISSSDVSSKNIIYSEIEKDMAVELFTKIIQIIQDSGIGFQIRDEAYSYLLSQE